MAAPLDVSVTRVMDATPDRVRRIMFDPRQDPGWMAAVTGVDVLDAGERPGVRARRTGRFLGRTIRWTTAIVSVDERQLELRIVDGPMRGTVRYRIEPVGSGSRVSIRNVGETPGYAPRWLLSWAMRRALAADLRRLQRAVEDERGWEA
jgi:uncharacterized membrane protein